MQLKIVLLFLVLVSVCAEQELQVKACSKGRAGECVKILRIAIFSGESEEEICRIMKEALQCLEETADECFGDNKSTELVDGLQNLREMSTKICPRTVSVRAEQEVQDKACSKERAGECVKILHTAVFSGESEEEICRIMKETLQCLEKTSDECFGDNKNPELEDSLQNLREMSTKICPRRDSQIPDKIGDCATYLQDELADCVTDSVSETLYIIFQMPGDKEPDENEIKCSIYESISKCVMKKIENGCEEESAKFLKSEITDALKDFKGNCQLSKARETLEGLLPDLAKRRRK